MYFFYAAIVNPIAVLIVQFIIDTNVSSDAAFMGEYVKFRCAILHSVISTLIKKLGENSQNLAVHGTVLEAFC